MDLTNLPLQTSRIEARATSSRLFSSCEDMQNMFISRLGRSLGKLVRIVGDEWELVEDAPQGSWQREDAARICRSLCWHIMGCRLVARITSLVIVGHCSPSREVEPQRTFESETKCLFGL